ncbi:MAG: hypothetical protein OEV08_07690 [Nitrospira sp.]|nr:hypothetical protein [Nitrospira sp.]
MAARPLVFSFCSLLSIVIIGTTDLTFAQVPGHAATSAGPIGASMAVLATLQDADVLPPENSPDANRVIKLVIQFQSVFMKSHDSTVQSFLAQALAAQGNGSAAEALSRFRSSGWTSEALEALNDQWDMMAVEQRVVLLPAFRRFNVSLDDFDWLMELVARARSAFMQRGQTLHQVFAQRRQEMPGGASSPQQGGRNGHESLYFDQGESRENERCIAVPQTPSRGRAGALLFRTA